MLVYSPSFMTSYFPLLPALSFSLSMNAHSDPKNFSIPLVRQIGTKSHSSVGLCEFHLVRSILCPLDRELAIQTIP